MNTRLRQHWLSVNESLWFIPGLMVLGAFGLSFVIVEFDAHTDWQGKKQYPLLFGVGADGSRGMLTAIAGSMLTVAALTFSLTLSTISQVSSQYSPRVLRNFMNDRANQLVMGYFVSVFTYCLIVLGTIRSNDEGQFVPATAVLTGLLLALGGVAALIFFIHHIAESLQTGTIVQHIFRETSYAIDKLFPAQLGESVEGSAAAQTARRLRKEGSGWRLIRSEKTGYLQRLDLNGLLQWATDNQVVLRMEREIGSFIDEGALLFSMRGDEGRPATSVWPDNPLHYVSIRPYRSVEQDVAFGVQQLVDITLKALSAGINDTTTAIIAIDYLGAIVSQLARRDFPAPFRSDGESVRILVRAPDFDAYVRLAFDLSRLNAKGDHAVFRRLLRALSVVAESVCSPARKSIIRTQASLLLDYAQETLPTDYERQQVRALYDELKRTWH